MNYNELCLKTDGPINQTLDSHCFSAGDKVSALIQFVNRNMNAVKINLTSTVSLEKLNKSLTRDIN